MRFAMVLNTYPPRLGGVEMHAFNLADQLTQQIGRASCRDRVLCSV